MTHSAKLQSYLADGEAILRTFHSFDIAAFFTDKRLVFIYTSKTPEEFEIEFVPYRTIERFNLLLSDKLSTYTLELFFPDKITLAFAVTEKCDAIALKNLLEKHII